MELQFDKIDCPECFVNIDLVATISYNYKLDVREIVAKEGGRLVAITKEVIDMIFILNVNVYWPINPKELVKEYKNHERLYRDKILAFRPIHLKRDERTLTSKDVAPCNINLFVGYFRHTYYVLCQIYGVDAQSMIPNQMLVLCMDIQNRDINKPFNYANILAEGLHKSLCDLKKGPSFNFNYYYILMHILMYNLGFKVWYSYLKVVPVLRCESLPIQ